MATNLGPEAEFREALQSYIEYPDGYSLSNYSFPTDETEDKVKGFARHFRENTSKLFSESTEGDIICVPIRDFRPGTTPDGPPYAADVYTIEKLQDLQSKAGMLYPTNLGHLPTGALQRDPLCRIIFSLLERQGWFSQLMNLDMRSLCLILTYHQVHPCYLNFLTCCGTKPTTGASDVGFGGFRGYVSPGAAAQGNQAIGPINSLGRSGRHYQLCLKLESFRRDNAASAANIPGRPRPSVYKPMATAIYHQFDVGTGTSLWIISNPLENINPKSPETLTRGNRVNLLWKDVKLRMAQNDYRVVDGNFGTRFQASLDVVHLLSEWSVGDMDYHLNYLDITFDGIARKYVNGLARFKSDGHVLEEDLRVMSQILLDLQHCRIVTEDNMRVLNHLRKFYTSLPRRLRSLGLTWHGDIQAGVGVLVGRLRPIIARTGSMLERIAVLERLTGSRADYIQKHIENATNKAMTELTIVTSDDSSAMRVFAFITLVLLPVTVVSTVMSMNMVQFNDMPDRSGGGGNVSGNSTADQTEEPTYDFSWLMFKTWITASLILTAICIAFSWTWAEVARLKRKNEKTLRELLFPPKQPRSSVNDIEGLRLGLGRGRPSQDGSDSSILTAIGLACSWKWDELAKLRQKKGGLRALIFSRWARREPQPLQATLDSPLTRNHFTSSSAGAHGGNGKQLEPSVTGALGSGTTTGFMDSHGNDPLPRWSTAPVPETTTSFTDRRGNGPLPRLSTAPVPGTSPALDTSSTAVGSSAPLQPQPAGGHVRSGSSVSQYSTQPFLAESQGGRHDSPV